MLLVESSDNADKIVLAESIAVTLVRLGKGTSMFDANGLDPFVNFCGRQNAFPRSNDGVHSTLWSIQ